MKYINFLDKVALRSLNNIFRFIDDIEIMEDYDGCYTMIDDKQLKVVQLLCIEENIRIMVSHNRDQLNQLMLNYCDYNAEVSYHIADLVYKELLKNNELVISSLKKLFKDVDSYLIFTVDAYLKNNMNVIKAAKEIYVHRNTFNYRLQQFMDLTGLDIRDYQNSLLFYYFKQL